MNMISFYKNLAVLVTGGAGFIGSHVAEELVRLGAQVTVIDNLSSGSEKNLAAIQDKITFIKGDIHDYQTCDDVTKNKNIIFHLAAFISVPHSVEQPSLCYQTNINGTLNLLLAAQKNNVKRFIFSSSAAVYGKQDVPCHENMVGKPESPYGHSKLIGELLCKQFYEIAGIEPVILRYFNVYGKRQNPQGAYAGVVAKFCYALEHNEPITICGDGLQTRDFVGVQEVVYANLLAGCAPKEMVAGCIFNIASGETKTLLVLLDALKKEYPHYQIPYQFMPARSGDIHYSAADCSRYTCLKNMFNF